MDREIVIATLRAHENELKSAGIVRLTLFGSVARGEAGPESDVDLLAKFDETRRVSVLDIVHMQNYISDLLAGTPVDLRLEGTLKPRVQANVSHEAVLAF